MQEHVLVRLMQLRKKLKQMPQAEHVDEVLCQLNVIMVLLLKHEVCIDFLAAAHGGSTVVPKVAELLKTCEGLGDEVCTDVQHIMSACLNATVLGSCETPLPCDGMSLSDKMQHMRSSLLLIL